MDKNVGEFLERYGIMPSCIDGKKILSFLLDEMEKGLDGRKSSLQMIPTYSGLNGRINPGDKVIVLDAGGTNFRTCLVTFDDDLEPEISEFRKVGMPGVKELVTAKQFFGILADNVERLIDKADRIGFCYSYAADITPDHDGIAKVFSKEIKAPEVVGMRVGASLLEELSSRGHDVSGKKIAILNDTVATLLATKAKVSDPCSGYVGFILGTGTNTAYAELEGNIGKLGLKGNERMIINVESGCLALELGELDREFRATTKDSDSFSFEKAISGAYLGPFSDLVIGRACDEGVFSEGFARRFRNLEPLNTMMMSNYLEDPLNEDYPLVSIVESEEDARALYQIIDAIIERAGKLTAINLTAAVLKSGIGEDPRYPAIINADGTTFYKTKGLEFYTRKYLDEILRKENGRYFKIVCIADSPVYGAAIAGAAL